MPGPTLSDDVLRDTLALVKEHGSVSGAARKSGIPYATLQTRHRTAMSALDAASCHWTKTAKRFPSVSPLNVNGRCG